MTIPNILSIGNIIQNAYVFNFKNWKMTMNTNSLLDLVARLFTQLQERNIEYVLVGGIAMLQYIQGRNTQDIDIIMASESLPQLPEIIITSQDEDFVRGQFEAIQIDFFLTRNPQFDKVKREYTTVQTFMEQNIPCATVEGLLLLKLYALPSLYRQGNFARVGLYENDISTLIHDYQPNISSLLAQLSPYTSDSDFKEIHNIIDEIQQRIKRFHSSFDA